MRRHFEQRVTYKCLHLTFEQVISQTFRIRGVNRHNDQLKEQKGHADELYQTERTSEPDVKQLLAAYCRLMN